MTDDPYKILGLKPGATDDEIKKAYKEMAKKYHPDLHGNSPEAAEMMKKINEAYDIFGTYKADASSILPKDKTTLLPHIPHPRRVIRMDILREVLLNGTQASVPRGSTMDLMRTASPVSMGWDLP